MAYKYEAYTLDKRIVQGTIDATSESMAEGVLYRAGYSRILSLREIRPGSRLQRFLPSLFGIKSQDVIEFSRQLATLIESGMPIITALGLLERQAHAAALKQIISGLSVQLQGGSSFSQALSGYPNAFSNIYCQVVKASEYTGNLGTALRQAAGYLEKNLTTNTRVIRALTYPVLVLLMSIGVFAIITNVALPPLVRLYTSLGAELPWTTRLLIFSTDFVTSYRLYLFAGLSILAILVVGYLRLPAGKLAIDRLMLKIFMLGPVNIQRNMSQFCRTTSLLLEAGLPLPQIMSIVIGTVSSQTIRQALVEVKQQLFQGQGLSQPMSKIALFPELLVEMVAVGEKSGTLPSALATLSDFYEQAVERRVHVLISMMQQLLMVVIGVIVGFIGISIMTPLYSILRAIR